MENTQKERREGGKRIEGGEEKVEEGKRLCGGGRGTALQAGSETRRWV